MLPPKGVRDLALRGSYNETVDPGQRFEGVIDPDLRGRYNSLIHWNKSSSGISCLKIGFL